MSFFFSYTYNKTNFQRYLCKSEFKKMVVVEFEHGPPTSFTESQIIALNSHLDVVNMDYYVTDKKLQHLLHLNEFVFLFQ